MIFNLARRFLRLLSTLLVLVGLAACARMSESDAYVVSGRPAAGVEQAPPCLHQDRPDRVRIALDPPAGGWSGSPQAVVVMNVFRGEVEIRYGSHERCGTLQDARTLDSRFRSGLGTVVVPAKGGLDPIEVEFERSPFPLWRPIVRLGAPPPVQRQDIYRFSLRVASMAVMLALVLSSLLTYVSTRKRAFLAYAVSVALFALWMALLSGMWAYPRPWLPLGNTPLRMVLAVSTGITSVTIRMLTYQLTPRPLIKSVRQGADWLMYAALPLACLMLLLPEQWLARASVIDEVGFYLLCVVLAGLALLAIVRRDRGGISVLSCVAPFLTVGVMEATMPLVLASWKVEAMMMSGCWLALTTSMALTLRLASLRRQRDEMRILAATDALTGLPNRRAALEHLAVARASALQNNEQLAVCFLDIDHFKAINDRYGHDVGDKVLQLFAKTLRKVFRDSDYVARIGGEEFLVVVPDTEPEAAKRRIESLRKLLDTIAAELQQPDMRVTLSAGVTGLLPSDADTEPLLHRADAAMYAAKRGGRDRVELAPATAQDPALT